MAHAQLELGTLPVRLAKGRRYLVGVSGGIDSVSLLEVLRRAGFLRLVVCHLDHGLRGRASASDARFVERLARAAGCEFAGEKADVGGIAARRGLSVETAAREARHAFFRRAADRWGTRTIFLAHHADDQAETILFNLLRGTGISGLCGMQPRQRIGQLGVIRPFLGIRRDRIEAFASAHRLAFRQDLSNTSDFASRNRIRNRLLPMLREVMGRDVTGALLRLAELAREDDAHLESLVPEVSARLPVRTLRELPVALQRRWVRQWLREQSVAEIGFDSVESVRLLASPDSPVSKVNLALGWHARRRAGEIFIER